MMIRGTMLFHALSPKKNFVNPLILISVEGKENHLLYGPKREFIFLRYMMVPSGLEAYPVIQMETQQSMSEGVDHFPNRPLTLDPSSSLSYNNEVNKQTL